MKLLVDIDPVRTAILVFTVMPETYSEAIVFLEKSPQQQYLLMKTISNTLFQLQEARLRASGKRVSSKNESKLSSDLDNEQGSNVQQSNEYMRKLQELLKHHKIEFDMNLHELYIHLLCQFDKKSVLDYLQENTDKYTIPNAQRSCERGKVLDASAYLQERSGDPKGALDLYIKSIKKCVDELWVIYQQHESLLPEGVNRVKVSKTQMHIFIYLFYFFFLFFD
ncbi:hypothetical protein RFI_15028 [Reticulomyxa filosa]|uniref:Uncharacterized protein n=1 Tax=Reticulomyxa filosa TaxID=46433 RepID=X6N8D4_RETFI|nr:hypothetical protein RFI_15028 [Reticulomyxa filosa]|eukprot:ETO22173.1 hypothetical protein RFI_15028 [Reticulomyxa filosa]